MEATATILSRFCFVDIETTGLDASTDEIVEIGAVFVERGVVVRRAQWLLKPTRPIPALITALTGLGDDEVRSARTLSELDGELAEALGGWTLVAHNASFERAFLGERVRQNAVLDSCEVAQLLFPERPSHSLDSLVRWLGVGKAARHRALDDAEDTFLVLAALCDRVLQEPARRSLESTLFHLRPPIGGDQAALCAFLEALDSAPRQPHRPATPEIDGADPLQGALAQWLKAPAPVCLEVERSSLLEVAWEAARAMGEPVAVAVPGHTFREQSDLRPSLPRRTVCATALSQSLKQRSNEPLNQFGRAYLSAWLSRTTTGDIEATSGFVRMRCAEVSELLENASPCECEAPECFSRRNQREWPVVLLSHEHALEWVERGAPVKLLFLDADRLPEAERRRTQRDLKVDALGRFGLPTQELVAALAAMPAGPVSLRARVTPAWLAIREALQNLAHLLRAAPVSTQRTRLQSRLSEVLELPAPGFETQVSAEGLSRVPTRVNERLARRLKAGHCLLSSYRGGLSWTRANPITLPSQRPNARLEWVTEALSVEQLVEVVAREAPVVLVLGSPLGPVAEACLRRGLSVSLDEGRSAAVQLCEWRRDRPPPAGATCVFYGVKEWRRAVLSSRADRVMLLSPYGLPAEPLARALQGFEPRKVTC